MGIEAVKMNMLPAHLGYHQHHTSHRSQVEILLWSHVDGLKT